MKVPALYVQFLALVLGWVLAGPLWAQPASLLEKRMTLRVTNERMDEVLRKIGNQGGFSFSYSPDAIEVGSRVSLNATNQSVREILNVLFDGTVLFKERRKYIILQKATQVAAKKPDVFYINGYVLDEVTGEKLPDASVFEPLTLASTVSNRYGYYKIKLPTQSESIRLEVRKEAYTGRSVEVTTRKTTYLSISLAPDTLRPDVLSLPPVVTLQDSLKPLLRSQPSILRPDSVRLPIEIPVVVVSRPTDPGPLLPIRRAGKEKATLKSSLQMIRDGLVYAFSTARQAIHVENIEDSLHRPFQASLMPFIGTNRELSGNVVNDVSVNLLAGYSLGVGLLELGLGFNLVRGDVYGMQAAGVANVVGGQVKGFQPAGIANLVIGDFSGFQTAPALNITAGDFRGLQLGALNVTGSTLDGWQLAGGLNIARRVRHGHQIGLLNYADSSATVPFGYFSFVRINGYRRLEFSTNEVHYANVIFKTGVRKFYNIFTLGTSGFASGKPAGSIGYGIGTARYLGAPRRNWMLNADYVASWVATERKLVKQPHALHMRLSVDLEKKITPRLALSVGPALNLLFSPYDGFLREKQAGLSPLWLLGKANGARSTYAWIGFQAGLRMTNRTY